MITRIVKAELQSKLLQRKIPYQVILPKNYCSSTKTYPVVYLLHGLFGSCENWLELTKIRDYVAKKDLIIVLVEGENGWYSDSITIENDKFESYFIEELLPEIENLFCCHKGKRAIAGLSMGGYGAFKFAINYSNLFAFAGSMSGAFIAPQLFKRNCPRKFSELLPSIEKVFGETESQARIENDLFKLIKQIPLKELNKLPYFYFDCGVDDVFLEINREFAKLLKSRNIPFKFYEISGGHDWDYWDKQLKGILQIIESRLNF